MEHSDFSYIRANFQNPPKDERLVTFLILPCSPADEKDENVLAEHIRHYVEFCKKVNVGTIIPCFCQATTSPEDFSLPRLRYCYEILLTLAQKTNIHVAFHLERALEEFILRNEAECYENDMRAQILIERSYACTAGETIHISLREGNRMSIVGFAEESGQVIELSSFVRDNELAWDVPPGNWHVKDYLSVPDTETDHANYLHYQASYTYISTAFSLFHDIFVRFPNTLNMIYYSDICYRSRNRRDWDATFNTVFQNRYHFSAVPHYPALFYSFGNKAHHLKAVFGDCRAVMLRDGFIKAVHDFSEEHHLFCLGAVMEPKTTACSWLSGDNIFNNFYTSGALLDKAYMYGTNSIKIAAGAAYNYDHKIVSCELFRSYYMRSQEILYKDTLNAFARGANLMLTHVPRMDTITPEKPTEKEHGILSPDSSWESDYATFVARMQHILRGGAHVADIALLYPIYSIHNRVYLYDCPAQGFEYPNTHTSLDYMSVINSLSIYAGHDLTVLHPETLDSKCRIDEGGTLTMKNVYNTESFRVIVLPGTEVIRLSNLYKLAEFFDKGGKIIATGSLPTMAFEYDETGENDREVHRLIDHIFGQEANSPDILRAQYYHKNDNGGEAYVVYPGSTAADGTGMVSGAVIQDILTNLRLPYDVLLPFMPRVECPGAFNLTYPEFTHLGLHKNFPGGGMINHIHKRRGQVDIYYFSNTTAKPYHNYAMIRGHHVPEEWDPHTGKTQKLPCDYITSRGVPYTRFLLNLGCTKARLIVCNGEGQSDSR